MKAITAIMIGTGALALSSVVFAAQVSPVATGYSKIQSINTYASDTTVYLEKNPVGCEEGFWMRPNQVGFKEKLKTLEDAAHLNSRIQIVGDGNDLWKQKETRNCRLVSVTNEPVTNVGVNKDTDGETVVDGRKATDEMAKTLDKLQPPSATEKPLQNLESPPPAN